MMEYTTHLLLQHHQKKHARSIRIVSSIALAVVLLKPILFYFYSTFILGWSYRFELFHINWLLDLLDYGATIDAWFRWFMATSLEVVFLLTGLVGVIKGRETPKLFGLFPLIAGVCSFVKFVLAVVGGGYWYWYDVVIGLVSLILYLVISILLFKFIYLGKKKPLFMLHEQ